MASILFVCVGNICRSPTAEGCCASRQRRPGSTISSSIARERTIGMSGMTRIGALCCGNAAQYLDFVSSCALVERDDFYHVDFIIAMDRSNYRALRTNARWGLFLLFGIGPDIGIFGGAWFAEKGHPEEIDHINPAGAEHAFFGKPAARSQHGQAKRPLDLADF